MYAFSFSHISLQETWQDKLHINLEEKMYKTRQDFKNISGSGRLALSNIKIQDVKTIVLKILHSWLEIGNKQLNQMESHERQLCGLTVEGKNRIHI